MIVVVVLLSLKSLKPAGASTGALTSGQQMMTLPAGHSASPAALAPAPLIPVVMPTNTMRDKVNSTIEQQPDVAARVVRAWLKEG